MSLLHYYEDMKERDGSMRRIAYIILMLICVGSVSLSACSQNTEETAVRDTDLHRTETLALQTTAAEASEELQRTPVDAAAETTVVTVTAEETAASTETETETETVIETEAGVPVTTVPKLRGLQFTEAEVLLSNAGLSFTVSEKYSRTAAAGEVLSVRFWGEVLEDGYAIEGDKPVSLTVSLGVRQMVNMTAPDENRIYLTFDDGPCAGTDEVLAILDTYGIKATFFTLGMYAAVYPKRISAIVDGGHCLACHSYSHDYMSLYESADTVFSEIDAWKRAVKKATGTEPEDVIFRFPGGSTTYFMDDDRLYDIFWSLTDAGIRVFDWTFADNDRYPAGKSEEQSMEDYLMASVKATLASCETVPSMPKIMLMHDTSPETIAVLPEIIEYLQGEGYTFGTLDELDGYWIMAGM